MMTHWQQNDWNCGGQIENILGEAELFTLRLITSLSMVTGKIIHQLQHDYLYNGLVALKNRSFVGAEGIDSIKGIGFYTNTS